MKTSDKPTCGDLGHSNRDGEPCGNVQGWGTDFDEGACKHHRGTSPDGKSHKNNGFSEKHGLNSDPLKYKERQDPKEADWIRSVRESILDRIKQTHGKEPDFLDEVLAERTAIQLHIVSNATEYVDENGLVQTVFVEEGGYEKDIPQKLVQELRQYDKDIISNLKKLGVLNDPDSQQASEIRSLAEVLSE